MINTKCSILSAGMYRVAMHTVIMVDLPILEGPKLWHGFRYSSHSPSNYVSDCQREWWLCVTVCGKFATVFDRSKSFLNFCRQILYSLNWF